MFRFEDVSYGPLRHVTFDIPPGITAVSGQSGSGKSTLLRLMSKLVEPTSGKISFLGKSLAEWDGVALRRQVLAIPQESFIWPGTIRDNLSVGYQFHNRPIPDDSSFCSVLTVVGLDKSLDTDCDTLSGGERARLSMARCLLVQRSWALWDEPTAALDADAAHSLFSRVRSELTGRDLSLVYVTHDTQLFASADTRFTVRDGIVEPS